MNKLQKLEVSLWETGKTGETQGTHGGQDKHGRQETWDWEIGETGGTGVLKKF